MKIKLLSEVDSVCGRFILPIDTVLTVTDTDEQRGVYEATYNDGFFVIPFLCAEAIIEPLPVEGRTKEEKYRPLKIKIIQSLPELENAGIKLGDEFYPLPSGDSFYRVEVDSWFWRVPKYAAEVIETRLVEQELPSKYHRLNTIKDKEFIDFYDIVNLLQNNGEQIPPEIQHALKKLMYNDRGHKNMVQDKKEAVWSVNRWLENNENS